MVIFIVESGSPEIKVLRPQGTKSGCCFELVTEEWNKALLDTKQIPRLDNDNKGSETNYQNPVDMILHHRKIKLESRLLHFDAHPKSNVYKTAEQESYKG